MVARAAEQMLPGSTDFLPSVQRAFETIGFAKTSASGPDAIRLGYLRPVDAVTMNRDRLISDAKARALERVREGYTAPPRRTAIAVGGEGVAATLKLGVHLAWKAGRISDHDKLIGRKLATIMAGGDLPHAAIGVRAASARPRARGVSQLAGGAENARANSAHVEDRQAAEELSDTAV